MPPKIIICDQNEGVRESLKLILQDLYDLILVDSTAQALDVIKHSTNNGILLINTNDVDESIQNIQPSIKMILLQTEKKSKGEQGKEKTLAETNATPVIHKPFKSDELIQTIKTLCKT
jgi:CheY-like chemotaxis protein